MLKNRTMNNPISIICEAILAILIGYHFISSYFSKDKSLIWSPITTVALTYAYYCLMPFWFGVTERYRVDEQLYDGYIFHIAALLSYVCILIGFQVQSKKVHFKKWNELYTPQNVGRNGVVIAILGVLGYASVRGFHFSFAADTSNPAELAMGGFVYYLMMMLDMLAFAAALLVIGIKHNKSKVFLYMIPFWLILVHFLIAGARWRIIVAAITMLTVYYLYPKVRKANVALIGALAIVMYMGFSIMDVARVRGGGIDMGKAQSLEYDQIKGGAGENSTVYSFSLQCMGRLNQSGERVYFQPLLTAVLMPIPRFLFPWKPDAGYLHGLELLVLGDDSGGAAYLNFVESFYSFGWFGVVFIAILLGWLARRIWDNYLNNRQSIGAVIALGVFSGLCYVIISRGYLASTFTSILICFCLPFWITSLYQKIFPNKK